MDFQRRAAVIFALELEYQQQVLIARRRLLRRRRRRRAHSWWVRPWLTPARRLEYGHYDRLMQELRHLIIRGFRDDRNATNDIKSILKSFIYPLRRESCLFRDWFWRFLAGDSVRMCEKLPCRNVATGLSWAYINYLSTTLGKDFKGRIQRFLRKKNITQGCINKMFVIVPKTCTVEESVEQAANQRSTNSTLEHLGKLKPVIADNGSEYFLHVYRHTNTQTGLSICFICEYATPINGLHKMAHRYHFAGLEKDDMYKQAEDFVKHTRNIFFFTSIVEFIFFDDTSQSLMSAIEDQLDHEHPMTFAQEVTPEGDANCQLTSFVLEHQWTAPDSCMLELD